MTEAFFDIPYYHDYISPALAKNLLAQATPVQGVPDLYQVGTGGGLECQESLTFLRQLYLKTQASLKLVLARRQADRKFIDERVRACYQYNQKLAIDFHDRDYQTVLGMEDAEGRIVIGPLSAGYCRQGGQAIAPLPDYLKGPHVTLFGPPDNAKMAINAMNAYHRKLKAEPALIEDLLRDSQHTVKWGADNEDSKTPLRADFIEAGINLTACMEANLSYQDPQNSKHYTLAKDHLSIPIKRFPGLAIPCTFMFWQNQALPLHLYDFALHFFRNWRNPQALAFYVPKLENEEEARYIHTMVSTAESLIKAIHPEYELGTIRLMIVLENPRAVFRIHEIMDALYPYFAGASLGWHDYLASTARVFKADANYRIPVKADPNIVIKHIKESHLLLADTVGSRGGIKVGGMYGILPMDSELESASFQLALKGFFKDVITQMKRDLSGFWVAHPDFVRLGLAIVEAWSRYQKNGDDSLLKLARALLHGQHCQDVEAYLQAADIAGLDREDRQYPRALLVANLSESDFIANHDPEEIRYNVFQSLQYLTDWLSGSGCVALPTLMENQAVRVMDDLATAERSRWEVWHEIHHGRFAEAELLKIAHEELLFIRKDLSNDKKIVQVKWDQRTARWYPIALRIMLQLMTSREPVEFATELLLPFTIDAVRSSEDPWQYIQTIDAAKYRLNPWLERAHSLFEACGSLRFVNDLAEDCALDLDKAEALIKNFSVQDIQEAATFHGDIGESSKTLDALASQEQSQVATADAAVLQQLQTLGHSYKAKFGFKYLVSAQGQQARDLLEQLQQRLTHSREAEIDAARQALWDITQKRLRLHPVDQLKQSLHQIMLRHQVPGAAVALVRDTKVQTLCFGWAERNKRPVREQTLFAIASLSKTIASAFALEYFRQNSIPISTSINALFAETKSNFRLRSSLEPTWADQVTIRDLLDHSALNMHYVNGFPLDREMPSISDLSKAPEEFGYPALDVIHQPGTRFQYSGGGYIVLEHLIETLSGKSCKALTADFLQGLGLSRLTFEQRSLPTCDYAEGYLDSGQAIPGSRLMFPGFAAGAMSTAQDMLGFLQHLGTAFHKLEGSAGISHDTAVRMLHGSDRGARDFMGADMGLGVFLAEAGSNRLALHQGANDGFRALYVYCFAGPDQGKGLVIFANGDNRAVACIAEMAQEVLQHFKLSGFDRERLHPHFDPTLVKQEERVNLQYKHGICDAFEPNLPEAIVVRGPRDPLAEFNLLTHARILKCSNQRFARAENLISTYLPYFDPELFGKQGKIMDSWESARHNPRGFDSLELELLKPAPIHYLRLSSQFHDGNQSEAIQILGRLGEQDPWHEILPKTQMQGHSILSIELEQETPAYASIRVDMFPDGGLSRLGLYRTLPEAERGAFQTLDKAVCKRFAAPIPKTQKPLTIKYEPNPAQVVTNLQRCVPAMIDYASLAFGAKLLRASDEHYSPAVQVISPFLPLHMFDGLESRRSRESGHYEELVIQLGRAIGIERIVVDFTFFPNNSPKSLSVAVRFQDQWQEIVRQEEVKAFAANKKQWVWAVPVLAEQLSVRLFPDGGLNRIHVFGSPV